MRNITICPAEHHSVAFIHADDLRRESLISDSRLDFLTWKYCDSDWCTSNTSAENITQCYQLTTSLFVWTSKECIIQKFSTAQKIIDKPFKSLKIKKELLTFFVVKLVYHISTEYSFTF